MVENSTYHRSSIKRMIIRTKLISYTCAKCSNNGSWQGELLSLNLEHKNGIPNDHRLENLEFLCPNCHSQTPTFAGKTKKFKVDKLSKARELALNKNGLCLSNACETAQDKLLWKCENSSHKEWLARYSHVIHSGTWCPECVKEQQKEHLNKIRPKTKQTRTSLYLPKY